MRLEVGEPWPAWHPDIRRARWTEGGLEQDVFAWFGSGDVVEARREAHRAMSYRGKHVMPLLAVERIEQRIAWIYPFDPVIAVGAIPGGSLGPRAVAEVLGQVVRALEGRAHPGPSVEHVVVDPSGTVRVAGFAGPWEVPPRYEAPGRGSPESAAAYRLGIFLATLLGSEFPPASTALEHETAVRRALITAMSASGTLFPESYRDLLRDLLAWDPRDRPVWAALGHRIEQVVESTPGPRLEQRVRDNFANWMGSWSEPALLDVDPFQRESTQEIDLEQLGDLHEEDEPTVDSELGTVCDRTPTSNIEFGSLPLRVGPPAEAMRRRPRLPEGFLGAPVVEPVEPTPPRWLTALGIFLLCSAVGMALWLLLGP